MMDKANAWSVLQKSLFVYDPDGTGFISRQHFIELMHQLRFTDQVMGKSAEVLLIHRKCKVQQLDK
jgi:Ca2+-binding EF-hand superfamily protein